jgi:hypothetical protein
VIGCRIRAGVARRWENCKRKNEFPWDGIALDWAAFESSSLDPALTVSTI